VSVNLHKCHYARWYSHIRPRFQFGDCDFGRFYGMIVDWLGWTLEVHVE
jgi:hypothetical protein